MDNGCINELYLKCEKCKENSIIIVDEELVCSICGLFLYGANSKIIGDKKKNKMIHFNDVLKNIESINQKDVDEVLKKIKKNKTDPNFIDSTYIDNVLKESGKKSYILNIQVYNQYLENRPFQTNDEKKDVMTVFNGFMKYLIENDSDILNNSIPYLQILFNIYKYLDMGLDIQMSASRNSSETLNTVFDNFLNDLCDKYFDKNKIKTDESFVPNIKNFKKDF